MRSTTILSTAVAIAMASDTAASSASAPSSHRAYDAAVVPKLQQQQQQQQPQQQEELYWYPEFGTDYESGRCTTTPSPALAAFAAGGGASSRLSGADREGCCETWFPWQELCGCLGGCATTTAVEDDDETTDDDASSSLSQVHASSSGGIIVAEEKGRDNDDQDNNYWYPKFDLTYEAGSCVKAGVNGPRGQGPPSYYTTEGGFLHRTLDSCCELWFGHQEDGGCLMMGGESAIARHASESVRGANNRTGSVPPSRGGIGSGAYESSSARTLLAAEESTR